MKPVSALALAAYAQLACAAPVVFNPIPSDLYSYNKAVRPTGPFPSDGFHGFPTGGAFPTGAFPTGGHHHHHHHHHHPSGGFPSGGFPHPSGGFAHGAGAPSADSTHSVEARREHHNKGGFLFGTGSFSGVDPTGSFPHPSGGFPHASGSFSHRGGFPHGTGVPSAEFTHSIEAREAREGHHHHHHHSGSAFGTGSFSGVPPTGTFSAGGFPQGTGFSAPSAAAPSRSEAPFSLGNDTKPVSHASVPSSSGSASSAGTATSASTTDGPVGYASQNGGTTGGQGGSTTTVSSLAQFTAAVTKDDTARVIVVSGTITGAAKVYVGSNKSIIGADSSAKLVGVGLYINKQKNVIVRNLAISKVLAENGDAIGIQASSNVWVDHCDLSSDRDHDKDYYDGLCDVTHASEWVTVSNSYIHDHWKASLVGHSDNNGDEDKGHLRVTYANNYWSNINSRAPSLRFGTGHIYNSYYDTLDTGINTRMGAQLLVESNVFAAVTDPLESADSDTAGYAVSRDNDFGGGVNSAPAGTLTAVPYEYTLLGSANVKAAVVGTAGNTLALSG
ncbi:hypothetical protein H2203_003355 [Taxawa tesnikishii (nom. ined.)]|nr:hypothetical protein H2203_003355 [Dothideales sp. JES 119]